MTAIDTSIYGDEIPTVYNTRASKIPPFEKLSEWNKIVSLGPLNHGDKSVQEFEPFLNAAKMGWPIPSSQRISQSESPFEDPSCNTGLGRPSISSPAKNMTQTL